MHEDDWLEAAYEDRNGGDVDTAIDDEDVCPHCGQPDCDPDGACLTYKVVRFYFSDPDLNRTVTQTGLTLEEAQDHCNDPESSSSSCTTPEGTQRTADHGPWFDGYEEE